MNYFLENNMSVMACCVGNVLYKLVDSRMNG